MATIIQYEESMLGLGERRNALRFSALRLLRSTTYSEHPRDHSGVAERHLRADAGCVLHGLRLKREGRREAPSPFLHWAAAGLPSVML